MKKSTLSILATVVLITAVVVSCSKSTPPPTAEITATIDGYTVTFNSTVTNVDSYSWNFGDGETSIEANPVHLYGMSGSYDVTLDVRGGGGEATATKSITIAPSLMEMLTGGEAAVNGKTWILSEAIVTDVDGIGPITSAMPITMQLFDGFLGSYGLGDEYDNEFTFYSNGHYAINPVNGNVLAGAVFGTYMGTLQGEQAYDIGMCAAMFDPLSSATFDIHNTDLTVDAITDPATTDIPPEHGNVTFTGKTWISLSEGAYFGILDFPVTAKFIIKEITPTKLSVALFNCNYNLGEDPEMNMLPTNLIHLTYIPKTTR